IQDKQVTVSLDLARNLPPVQGDRTQLQQVVVNLALNAIQAMAQPGVARRILAVRTTASENGTVSCTFEDSGPGIPPQHLDRLFHSFFTTKESGMGLGLAVSRSIIEGHGGELQGENGSAYGGARFSFTLPVATERAGSDPSAGLAAG